MDVHWSPFAGGHKALPYVAHRDTGTCRLGAKYTMEPGILPGSFQSGHARAFARMTRVSSSQTRAATPRPAAHTMRSDTPIRRRHPASSVCESPTVAGMFFGGPPGRRMARRPPASCGLMGRATDQRSAGILAGGVSARTTEWTGAPITVMRRSGARATSHPRKGASLPEWSVAHGLKAAGCRR